MNKNTLRTLSLALVPMLLGAAVAVAAETVATNENDTVTVTPGVRYISIGGDYQRFRQFNMMKEHFTGGIEDFTFDQRVGKNVTVHADGHLLFEEQDYKMQLEIVKPEAWFFRTDFSQYRKYYDSTGGVYSFAGYPNKTFSLNQDLYLNIGNFKVEFGLTLPNIPKMILGYERQYKDGSKSLSGWGSVTTGGLTRKIYPTPQTIDESVDIVKFSIEHDIKNIHLADDLQYELYNNNTGRTESRTFGYPASAAPTRTTKVYETFNHDAFFNTLRIDSHLNEKVYWSLGYLYTTLDGDAGIRLITAPPPLATRDKNWYSNGVTLGQDVHMVNANAMFGPFEGLTISGGLETEFEDSKGYLNGVLTEQGSGSPTVVASTDADKKALKERLGLRYTKIPFTTLFLDADCEQGKVNVAESQTSNDQVNAANWTRQYEMVTDKQEARIGFNTSPFQKMTLSSYYRFGHTDNDYQPKANWLTGTDVGLIKDQIFTTHEFTTKLTLRPISRLSLTLKYQLVSSDIETTTVLGAPASSTSGNYEANIYSLSATVTPVDRLYITGLFSYQNARTVVDNNGWAGIMTYVGDVYSAMGSCGYAIDNKTDVVADYSTSWAKNNQGNANLTLPLGVNYTQHSANVTLSRQLTKRIRGQLRYGFYQYDDDWTAGANNYTAHLIMASCAMRF